MMEGCKGRVFYHHVVPHDGSIASMIGYEFKVVGHLSSFRVKWVEKYIKIKEYQPKIRKQSL